MQTVYLDNSSTTKPFDKVVERVSSVMTTHYGNPSSVHKLGVEAEKIINEAKEILAGAVKAKPSELVFTSGGTESNNLAIKGIARKYRKKGRHIITSVIEHRSVLNTMKGLEEDGFEITYLPVDETGKIVPEQLREAMGEDTILVSIMHANNETGVIQPMDEISNILIRQKSKPVFHVDAVQSFGKLPLALYNSDIDMLTVSSHKVHGPKGVGALYLREGINVDPLLLGGGQEEGRRSGTENMPGIAGFAEAISLIYENREKKVEEIKRLRDGLANKIQEKIPAVKINTPLENSVPHILNISFPGLKGEVLLRSLESEGIYVSTSSACNSRKKKASHVLNAMGLTNSELEGAIRISLSVLNNKEEMDYCFDKLMPVFKRLKKMGNL